MKIACLERGLSSFFRHGAEVVSRRPAAFLAVPFLIGLILTCGLFRKSENNNNIALTDDVDAYTPSDGRAKRERASLEMFFRVDESDPFYAIRRYDTRRSGYLLITTKNDNENILNAVYFKEIKKIWPSKVEKISVETHDAHSAHYSDICVTINGACLEHPLMRTLDYGNRSTGARSLNLTYPVAHFPASASGVISSFFLGDLLGGVRLNKYNFIEHASAILLPYQLKYDIFLSPPTSILVSAVWESALFDEFSNDDLRDANSNLSISVWTSTTLANEALSETRLLQKLLAPLFVLVASFTVACCFVRELRRSKPWLGMAGVLSAVLAIGSALGLLRWCGEKFTPVTYFMPFIIFSIGVDNVFILLSAWRKTPTSSTVIERMSATFGDAGVSITVTSLTDAISFAVGCASNFPAVKNFCLFSVLAVIFVYIYQFTFFAGAMVVSGNREAANRHCLTLKRLKTDPKVEKNDENDNFLARFFGGVYTDFLMRPCVKAVVLTSFILYVVVSAWACTRIEFGLRPMDLLSKRSPARSALERYERYFDDYNGQMHVWMTVNLTAYPVNDDRRFWLAIRATCQRFNYTYFSGEIDDVWLRDLLRKDERTNLADILRREILTRPQYGMYLRDVVFSTRRGIGGVQSEDSVRVAAIRFMLRLRRVSTFENQSAAVRLFRRLADEESKRSEPFYDVNVYHEFFHLAGDQYASVLPSLLQNIAVAAAAVICVSLLFIPRPSCALWVCLTIVSITVGVFGYMTLWDVRLDFVSMVTIIMGVGFSVDFSAHVAYHFACEDENEVGKNRNAAERIRNSLKTVGGPIVQSAVSTLLGVLVLIVIDNYVVRSFLKTSFLIIIFGAAHGLVILPVFLTLFFRDDHTKSISSTDGSMRNHNGSLERLSKMDVGNSIGKKSIFGRMYEKYCATVDKKRKTKIYASSATEREMTSIATGVPPWTTNGMFWRSNTQPDLARENWNFWHVLDRRSTYPNFTAEEWLAGRRVCYPLYRHQQLFNPKNAWDTRQTILLANAINNYWLRRYEMA